MERIKNLNTTVIGLITGIITIALAFGWLTVEQSNVISENIGGIVSSIASIALVFAKD